VNTLEASPPDTFIQGRVKKGGTHSEKRVEDGKRLPSKGGGGPGENKDGARPKTVSERELFREGSQKKPGSMKTPKNRITEIWEVRGVRAERTLRVELKGGGNHNHEGNASTIRRGLPPSWKWRVGAQASLQRLRNGSGSGSGH